jgi:hypothetical protein
METNYFVLHEILKNCMDRERTVNKITTDTCDLSSEFDSRYEYGPLSTPQHPDRLWFPSTHSAMERGNRPAKYNAKTA